MDRTKQVVIYHKADFDGQFCREVARKRLGEEAVYLGWDYGEPEPVVPADCRGLYILDLSVPGLMEHPNLVWIDHHRSAIEKYPAGIAGYRIDGVAACRLAWQWFNNRAALLDRKYLPTKELFVERTVSEPKAVRLAGEYDVWDKRDPEAEVFQSGLRSLELTPEIWAALLDVRRSESWVEHLLSGGRAVKYAKDEANRAVITALGFDVEFEGLKFLALNAAFCNSLTFTAGLRPEHEGCLGFKWTGKEWAVSLYGVPGKPEVDLGAIAVKYGGGGHKQACGFRATKLPWIP